MRRNFFGRGGPFGPDGPFGEEEHSGFGGWGKRFFGRGDLKYALLELLQERPMHGYEMMKALQERTGGMYTPSAGSVYPTLQMLEDRGFVTVSEADGKKVHSITDAGRAFLAEGQQEERGAPDRRGPWHAPEEDWAEMAALVHNLRSVMPLLGNAWRNAARHPKRIKRLRNLVEKLRAELEALANEASEAED
jgi:DNA-binding PadR family transcriptional regulator